MDVQLPPDKARISLNGEFSALEIEEIIRDLAAARASLQPPVPTTAPSLESDATVLSQEDALFAIRTLAGGGLRFWLRNEGIGWLALTINATAAEGLRQFLSNKIGHTYTAH